MSVYMCTWSSTTNPTPDLYYTTSTWKVKEKEHVVEPCHWSKPRRTKLNDASLYYLRYAPTRQPRISPTSHIRTLLFNINFQPMIFHATARLYPSPIPQGCHAWIIKVHIISIYIYWSTSTTVTEPKDTILWLERLHFYILFFFSGVTHVLG